jgi:hypothetical protein
MITESDVRAVLTEQAHDISEPDDILARITFEHRPGRRRAPGQRHWIAPVAAAAVAAVVAGAVALTSVNHRTQNRTEQAASHTLPPMGGIELRFIGAMGRVPNYQIGQPVFAVDRQLAPVSGHGTSEIADVTVYAAGAFQPSKIKHAQPVTVGQIHGLFGEVPVTVSVPSKHVVPTPTLAWQLSSGRWATVSGWWPSELAAHHLQLDPLTEAKRIAAAFDTSVSRPFLVPFRVGYLPSGLERTGGQSAPPPIAFGITWHSFLNFRSAAGGSGLVDFGAWPNRGTRLPSGTFDLGGHPALIHTVKTVDATQHPNKTNETLNLDIYFGQTLVIIATKGVSRDELIKIGRSVSVASNVNDPSTWFDASK